MYDNYFKFNLYNNNLSLVVEQGKYVFQNFNDKISEYEPLPSLVFHFVTNYNLDDLELFFRLAGFNAFPQEKMLDVNPKIIKLTNDKWLFIEEEKAKSYIESELGAGIIEKYQSVKGNQVKRK
jgi:hypothetical protein